MTDCSAR